MSMEFDLAAFKTKIGTETDKLTVIIKCAHEKKVEDDEITRAIEFIIKQDPQKRISGECLQKAACFGYIKLAKLLLDSGVPVAKTIPFPPVISSKYLHFINKSELC